jgi:putative transposase
MTPPKGDEMDYINFLITAQRVFNLVEASQTLPTEEQAPAHDANKRLLKR